MDFSSFNLSFGDTKSSSIANPSFSLNSGDSSKSAPVSFGGSSSGIGNISFDLSALGSSDNNKEKKENKSPGKENKVDFSNMFGGSSASSSSTSTASSSGGDNKSAGTTTSTAEPASRIKNRTVEEIIQLWNKDLEDHVQAFTEQALEVKKWDQQLIDNGNKIIALQKSVQQAQVAQVKLNRILQTIKISQQDLLSLIENLEKVASDASKANLKPGSDEIKRAEAYKMAEEVDAQLVQMSDSLSETVKKLNSTSDKTMDPSNPLTQIVKILNVQMNSLQWVEATSAQLEGNLRKAHELLRQHSQTSTRRY